MSGRRFNDRRVAVLGAGIQGSMAALALAGRGLACDLIDEAPLALTRASLWNEGKLHLGFVFANDPSLRTARLMQVGSIWFLRILEQLAGAVPEDSDFSAPFHYLVSQDSIVPAPVLAERYARIEAHFMAVQEAAGAGYPSSPLSRLIERDEIGLRCGRFDDRRVRAAFASGERAVDPRSVALLVRRALDDSPLIRFLPGTTVKGIRHADRGGYVLDAKGPIPLDDAYDHVVNATWENRLALDLPILGRPARPWLHRYKLACFTPASPREALLSATIVLGPFGDLVWYDRGHCYISWYPVGRIHSTDELAPGAPTPPLPPDPVGHFLPRLVEGLQDYIPALTDARLDTSRAAIGGGYIFAWGSGDVDQRDSGLHKRFEVGLGGETDYVSIDTGKYCLAPLFALQLAQRLTGVCPGDVCEAEAWLKAAA